MADAPSKTRTVHLSAAAKEAARKARVADKVLVDAGLKRAQNSNAEAPRPKNRVSLLNDKHTPHYLYCMHGYACNSTGSNVDNYVSRPSRPPRDPKAQSTRE